MPIYYVRKNGSDSYTTTQAQNASTAWLTIQKALDNVAAGDEVRVGAGTYREALTVVTTGSSGSEIEFYGDLDGSYGTGDAGIVIVTSAADENTWSTNNYTLSYGAAGRRYYKFANFIFSNANLDTVIVGNEFSFDNCIFFGQAKNGYSSLYAVLGTSIGFSLTNSVVVGSLEIGYNESAGDIDLNVTISNCLFLGCFQSPSGLTGGSGISIDRITAGTYSPGGIDIDSCTFYGSPSGVWLDTQTTAATTYKVNVTNCSFVGQQNALYATTSGSDWMVSSYNQFSGVGAEYTNVSVGTGDNSSNPTGIYGCVAGEIPILAASGLSRYLPFEPLLQKDPSGTGAYAHPAIDGGSTTLSVDYFGNPRPMGDLSTAAADDHGAVESRGRPRKETSTTYSGSTAIRFDGAGVQDFLIPVDPASTTVTIYARYDSTYSGTLPKLELINAPGVSTLPSDTMTSGSGTWEQLSINFTPTSQGVARVRITSSDTSAGGQSFFDLLAVT